MVLYKKAVITKDGETKIYVYSHNSSKYSKKAYDERKEKYPKKACPVCGRMVYGYYMVKHQAKTTCRPNALNHITIIPAVQESIPE
jgi:hypothetical protein